MKRTIQGAFQKKSLLLIPYQFAIKMTTSGWCLRNVIIWHKVNPLPQSVKDRFNVDFEPIFFFTKKPTGYYYERQLSPYKTKATIKHNACKLAKIGVLSGGVRDWYTQGGRNMATTWSLTSGANEAGDHVAFFPKKLVARMLKSGCPTGGIVLDPFMGSGTTAVVAKQLDMNYIGFELNADYCKIANQRIINEINIFEE